MKSSSQEAHDLPNESKDGFNRSKFIDACEGDEDFAKSLAEVFLESTRESMSRFTTELSKGDAAAIMAEAHKLKGSSFAVNAQTLGRLCSELEALCATSERQGLDEIFGRMEAEFAQVELILRPLLEE